MLGVTSRRLRQRDNDEFAPPKADGRYPCKEYGEWLRAECRRGMGIGEDGEIYDYSAERARLTHHQANIAALDQQVKAGELVPIGDVLERWRDLVANARARLLTLPDRVASTCANMDCMDIEREARGIIYEALTELGSES